MSENIEATWTADINQRIYNIEARVAFIEGKDVRDHDLLIKIENKLDFLSTKMEDIDRKIIMDDAVIDSRKKILWFIGCVCMFIATIVGGSDIVLRHIGMS